jgi:DNA polymerase I
LVLEVDPTALKDIQQLVVQTMEKALPLSVPLVVETGVGDNWMDAK